MRGPKGRSGEEAGGGKAMTRNHDSGGGGLHINVWLFQMSSASDAAAADGDGDSDRGGGGGGDGKVDGYNRTWASLTASAASKTLLMQYPVLENERSRLLDIRLDAEPRHMLLVISTDSLKPLPVALDLVSLGVLGPAQVRITGPTPDPRSQTPYRSIM